MQFRGGAAEAGVARHGLEHTQLPHGRRQVR
jgi:hypothetical protein